MLAHNNLAEVLRVNRRYDEALGECRTALELNPELPEGHRTMARILLDKNDLDGAMKEFQIALKLKPDDPLVYDGLADGAERQGKFRELAELRIQQVAQQPAELGAFAEVARALTTDPLTEARNGAAAVEIARRVCEATKNENIEALDVLAAASAETGDFGQARGDDPQSHGDPPGPQRQTTRSNCRSGWSSTRRIRSRSTGS